MKDRVNPKQVTLAIHPGQESETVQTETEKRLELEVITYKSSISSCERALQRVAVLEPRLQMQQKRNEMEAVIYYLQQMLAKIL